MYKNLGKQFHFEYKGEIWKEFIQKDHKPRLQIKS
jgi:hypothetical protein